MALKIEVSGLLYRIVVTSLPRSFVARVFKHCLGKNNTPYFVNNCFKGVLYFDQELAIKFAESVGYIWKGWQAEAKFYSRSGYCFDRYLDISVWLEEGEKIVVNAPDITASTTNIPLASILPQIGADETLILLGAVDKGSTVYALDGEGVSFDLERLQVHLDSLDEFFFPDRVLTGMQYGGKSMLAARGRSTGRNMIAPVLISGEGAEMDMYDFLTFELPI